MMLVTRIVDKDALKERLLDILEYGGWVSLFEIDEFEKDELVDSLADEVYSYLSELDTGDLATGEESLAGEST